MPVNVVCVGVRGDDKPTNIVLEQPVTVELFKQQLKPQLCPGDVYLCCAGEPLTDTDVIGEGVVDYGTITVHVFYPLTGGKGGFGSLIRATRSHINKSSDRLACRDISGRRVRDVKAEKKIADWIATEPERKRQRTEKRNMKLKKLMEEPKHKFNDGSYMAHIKSTEEGMADSLKQGLEAAGTSKRIHEDDGCGEHSKRPRLQWLGEETLDSSDSEDEPSSHSETENIEVDDKVLVKGGTQKLGQNKHQHVCLEASMGGSTNSLEETKSNGDSSRLSAAGTELPVPEVNVKMEPVINAEVLDLASYSCEDDLLDVGGDQLKAALQRLGLKCGGTPLERAQRLFSTKGKSLDELDPSLFAKKGKKGSKLS